MQEIKKRVLEHLPKAKEHRRWLHENPEPSHYEKETGAYLAAALRAMGLPVRDNVGGYGVVAVIEGAQPGPCVALRADFDALEVNECTGVPFASKKPGLMHACGHDVHAAMLLGAAYVLQDMKAEIKGSVKLIFQPSEEDAAGSGAKAMIADGCLENPHVDAIFGQHVWPEIDTGRIGARDGNMMAASDRFFLTVHGKASHGGAAPQEGVDAIVIAGHIITALQTVVSRNVSPVDSAVISVGTIRGGTRYNVIADHVVMEGTCRNLSPQVHKQMPGIIQRICENTAAAFGGTCEVDYRPGYPPTFNTPESFAAMQEAARQCLGENGFFEPKNASLGGEDFSFYCEKIPAGFAWLGCHQKGEPLYPIHNGRFLPDENVMPIGIEFLVRSALNYLDKAR